MADMDTGVAQAYRKIKRFLSKREVGSYVIWKRSPHTRCLFYHASDHDVVPLILVGEEGGWTVDSNPDKTYSSVEEFVASRRYLRKELPLPKAVNTMTTAPQVHWASPTDLLLLVLIAIHALWLFVATLDSVMGTFQLKPYATPLLSTPSLSSSCDGFVTPVNVSTELSPLIYLGILVSAFIHSSACYRV